MPTKKTPPAVKYASPNTVVLTAVAAADASPPNIPSLSLVSSPILLSAHNVKDQPHDNDDSPTNSPMKKSSPGLKRAPPKIAVLAEVPDKNTSRPDIAALSPYTSIRNLSTTTAPTEAVDLRSFGIMPASQQDKDAQLKCCMIAGPKSSTIVFRIQPNDPDIPGGSWAEKCFFDALRFDHPWLKNLNFHTSVKPWFHNNVPQTNSKHYPIRLFLIPTEAKLPPKEAIVSIGNYICTHLNAVKGNKTKTSVDEQSFFWIDHDAVWSNVLGYDAALQALIKEIGQPTLDCYDKHHRTIHSFFHPGTFSVELACTLHAPLEQVHESLHQEFLP
jgi:hypothetical protein